MSADQQLALARATRGESSHLSKAAQKVVPPFLQKLYEIVNDAKNDELIRWSENGDSFYVLNHERFAREVLGRWFKHQKFTSFVRQLNMYGFHKIPHLQQGVLKSETDTEPWHFEHPHFHRGQPDLLCLIQRKKQPAHGAGDDLPLDINETGNTSPPMANLTPGQVLDINSIMNGISAIKRHQQAISADLNELKSSNQHLWQEAIAARERHKKHQDTINRILKFLAGVFGNSAEAVKHDGSHTPPPVMPRKRQRLMIEQGGLPEKRKAAVVEEVDDDEDDRRSVRSDGGVHGGPVDPMKLYASIETPDSSIGPRSPSITPSEGFGPTITDISSTYRRPTDTFGRAASDVVRPSNISMPLDAPSPPNMSLATMQGQQLNNSEWSATLQNLQTIMNSPSQMQRLMQALAAQQNQPAPPMPIPPNPADVASTSSLDPRLVTHQLAAYDPSFDISRFRNDIPSSAVSVPSTSVAPSLLGPLIAKDDGPSLEPLVENANRLQKTYHDSSEIDADVDALQISLNSLIHNLGLEPSGVASTSAPPGDLSSMNVDSPDLSNGVMSVDPSADFDFDAFLNELSSRGGDNSFTDVTGRFDPSTPLDGTTIGDASTEQLAAFLDDVSSDSASLQEPLDQPSSIPSKRKSDVADFPPPLLSAQAAQSPKARRKR
ncbi:hypothetical protein BDW22DRAFT_1354137 [Trametopsis cervina]|nr:hypothetical protein BDW22DRAFT_1354137 [Trametopsis cervina]